VPFTLLGDAVNGGILVGRLDLTGLVVTAIGTIIASTITAPFTAGVTGLLYFDQRIRKEAFDIQLNQAAHQW
jgi:hypothetical protein